MTPMRTAILGVLLAGCAGGEQNFSQNDDDGDDVDGVAEMTLSAETLVFTELNYEQVVSQSQTLTVTNVGDSDLKISTLDVADSGGGVFYVATAYDVIITPGTARDFDVVATLEANEPAVGSLRLQANDADYLDHRIQLCGFPLGWTGSTECEADTGGDTGGDTGDTGG